MQDSVINTKKLAAEMALDYVRDGMILGLGTGSTAYWAIRGAGERVRNGLKVRAVATSMQSEALAREAGIPVIDFSDIDHIDLTIDGADEVDEQLNLIKGGGGALLREKIVAAATEYYIIIVDESKLVSCLGKFPLPVEVAPFGWEMTRRKLEKLGCTTRLRMAADMIPAAPKNTGGAKETAAVKKTVSAKTTAMKKTVNADTTAAVKTTADKTVFLTDNGHYILDCSFGSIGDPALMHEQVNAITGVMDNGLFIRMANLVVVGYGDGGTRMIERAG